MKYIIPLLHYNKEHFIHSLLFIRPQNCWNEESSLDRRMQKFFSTSVQLSLTKHGLHFMIWYSKLGNLFKCGRNGLPHGPFPHRPCLPGLLWLGPCRTATLVRGAGVGHILPWFPPARRVAARISSHPLVALAPSQTLSGRLCHQWCGGRWTGMPEAPVEMDIPVLRLLNGHFRQHVYKCSVHPLYQTVRLWVANQMSGGVSLNSKPGVDPPVATMSDWHTLSPPGDLYRPDVKGQHRESVEVMQL
ncbi:conserved hypothetical protein [Trichinella spiralis]|uniref:hypothetical protein n=1 Tax=Trichinella spiralis TaxID=6334 RepID=UPI0001EFBAE4|nr:conserved hypothetical protein [Trichinella spiralis]